MRKKIYIMIAILMVAFASCSNSDKKLREFVQAMNELSESGLGSDIIDIDKAEYDGHAVTITYTLSEDAIEYDGVMANKESFRNNMLLSYVHSQEEGFVKLLDLIVKADADLNVVFNVKNHDEAIKMNFTAEELKNKISNTDANPMELLEAMVENTRIQTPNTIDDGLVMSDALLESHYFTFVYECDESIYDIDLMEESMDELKEIMRDEVVNPVDTMTKALVDLLKEVHYGLKYKYVGSSSGKVCSVCIEPDEF